MTTMHAIERVIDLAIFLCIVHLYSRWLLDKWRGRKSKKVYHVHVCHLCPAKFQTGNEIGTHYRVQHGVSFPEKWMAP